MEKTYKKGEDMPSGSLKPFLKQIGDDPLLTADEERNLSNLYQEGKRAKDQLLRKRSRSSQTVKLLERKAAEGEEARQKLIGSNLRLVISNTFKYARRLQQFPNDAIDINDLAQDGMLGLIRAVEDYDPEKARFSTYATWWIIQHMQRGLDNTVSTIRIPVYMVDRRRKVLKSEKLLQQRQGRQKIAIGDVARAPDLTEREVTEVSNLPWTISLDEPLPNDGSGSETERIKLTRDTVNVEAEALTQVLTSQLVEAMREALTPREQLVLQWRYWDGLNGPEIGKKLDLTKQRVERIENHARVKLAYHLKKPAQD
ncbi:MAG TPA: sigma-70 family RNA polymerase sigma factor [candidate division WWE3 bacterium]|uniref:Sigma-70 family RNA polymerase sigma factor n=1 Tax=candidate division WWE3 bacterium TaxID=2053526 RepID=A0A7C1NME6_UNCKA|nr:sigma-70 family RNA polymerase sigma factor [candidate division WWE3 bacterium]